ncbi:MAG TPA: hydrogenase maturation protease [Candidatus Tripitaka californicus]|uniref:hydrogenase maturation protease n=1 Tax=Candidatus Tripitaka californicus TaxID=3367616 RepID=UPI004025FDA8|nr:hydrogenase maturation protease [Planctomycetota bacterium]
MEKPIPPVAIIGIGNPLLGDDGVGVEVIKELERLTLPSHVRLYDGGVGGFSLLGLIDGHREAIFVDALEMGLEPGSIRQLDVKTLQSLKPRLRYSLHEVSLRECLPFLQLADNPPKITIIGIQPRRVGPGIGLSPEVKGSVSDIIRIILEELGARACGEQSRSPERSEGESNG